MKKFNAVLSAIVIIAIAGIVVYELPNLAAIRPASVTPTTTTTTTTSSGTTVQTQSAGYTGTLNLNDVITNALTTATLTDGTNAAITYYQQNPDGTYRSLGTSASNTLAINASPQVPTIYMGIVVPSGQAFYPALDKMGTAYYSRLGTPFWGTPNLSNLYQPVYPLSVANLQGIGTGLTTPSLQIPIQLYGAATSTGVNSNGCTTGASASCGASTYVSNSNKTAVGAGLVQNIETIPYTFSTGGTAVAWYQFTMTLNDTTLADINTALSNCQFPTGLLGAGSTTITWAQAQQVPGASTTKYIFNVAPDLTIRTAPLVEAPKIGNNQVNVVCTIATNFAATNNGATFSPSMTWVDMQAALNTINTHIFKIVA